MTHVQESGLIGGLVEEAMRQIAEVAFRDGYRFAKPDATDDEVADAWREWRFVKRWRTR